MDNQIFRIFFLLILFISFHSFAQETEQIEETHKRHTTDQNDHHGTEPQKKHAISASINHTVIFSGIKDGENKTYINVPSFGLNYTYAFNEKWAIGLHNDIILEDFVVQGNSHDGQASRSSVVNQ